MSGDSVLWWIGRRAGHESVSSQDEALVFQGVLSGAADLTDRLAGCRYIHTVSLLSR